MSTTGERFERAVAIMERLRAPGGCPWDREQTFDTIKPYTLEDTYEVLVDIPLKDAKAEDFHALLLPGGFMNSDRLRMIPEAGAFVKHFAIGGKPVAAICYGPWTLIEADAVRGRTMTSWPSLKTDLINAGAYWIDAQVVRGNNLVTSRKPDDIPAFSREMIRLFMEAAGAKPSLKTE